MRNLKLSTLIICLLLSCNIYAQKEPPRTLEEIEAEMKEIQADLEILKLQQHELSINNINAQEEPRTLEEIDAEMEILERQRRELLSRQEQEQEQPKPRGNKNQRRGFVLGLGAGAGLIEGEEVRFSSNFKIGGAPSDMVAIYWGSQVDWFSVDNELFANGVGGLGLTFYAEEESPSFLVNTLVGIASLTPISETDLAFTGFGWGFGIGYEFARHFSTEVNYTHGNLSNNVFDLEVETWSVRWTLNWLLY